MDDTPSQTEARHLNLKRELSQENDRIFTVCGRPDWVAGDCKQCCDGAAFGVLLARGG
jgi:hypothetical protein